VKHLIWGTVSAESVARATRAKTATAENGHTQKEDDEEEDFIF
jgi:hypothetical protein